MLKQNTYEKKHRTNSKPEALITNQTEKKVKEESIQKMKDLIPDRKKRTKNDKLCKFWNATNWNPTHKRPAMDKTTAGRKDISHGHADKEAITNAKYEM